MKKAIISLCLLLTFLSLFSCGTADREESDLPSLSSQNYTFETEKRQDGTSYILLSGKSNNVKKSCGPYYGDLETEELFGHIVRVTGAEEKGSANKKVTYIDLSSAIQSRGFLTGLDAILAESPEAVVCFHSGTDYLSVRRLFDDVLAVVISDFSSELSDVPEPFVGCAFSEDLSTIEVTYYSGNKADKKTDVFSVKTGERINGTSESESREESGKTPIPDNYQYSVKTIVSRSNVLRSRAGGASRSVYGVKFNLDVPQDWYPNKSDTKYMAYLKPDGRPENTLSVISAYSKDGYVFGADVCSVFGSEESDSYRFIEGKNADGRNWKAAVSLNVSGFNASVYYDITDELILRINVKSKTYGEEKMIDMISSLKLIEVYDISDKETNTLPSTEKDAADGFCRERVIVNNDYFYDFDYNSLLTPVVSPVYYVDIPEEYAQEFEEAHEIYNGIGRDLGCLTLSTSKMIFKLCPPIATPDNFVLDEDVCEYDKYSPFLPSDRTLSDMKCRTGEGKYAQKYVLYETEAEEYYYAYAYVKLNSNIVLPLSITARDSNVKQYKSYFEEIVRSAVAEAGR